MTHTPKELSALPRQAECLYDRQTIDRALDQLAEHITAELTQAHPLALCVLHGGLIFSGHLLTRLNFPLRLDYVHATRYRGAQQGKDLRWIATPHGSLRGRTILLLDDIFDEGYTLNAIRDYCIAQGAERVLSAVLVTKKHPRPTAQISPDFSALEVDDRYIFGFGMDYEHEWRNANGIYAL